MKIRTDGYSHFKQIEVSGDPDVSGNGIQINPADAGSDVAIAAVGDDTNINLALTPKGSGIVSSAADGFVNYAEIALTAAEIKALRATPKELVAAPGAGKMLRFLGAELLLDATATAFTESADNMAIKYTDGSGVAVSDTIEATGFIDQTADTATSAVPVKDAIVAATGCDNEALVLHNTGDGEYATGTGTMRVKVWYAVLSTGW